MEKVDAKLKSKGHLGKEFYYFLGPLIFIAPHPSPPQGRTPCRVNSLQHSGYGVIAMNTSSLEKEMTGATVFDPF
jgi:hypothetical protein